MRTFFNGLLLGLLAGGVLGWFGHGWWGQPSEANDRAAQQAEQATEAAGAVLFHAAEAMKAKAHALNLQPERIREELARTGQVVRRQTVEIGSEAMDTAAEVATTAQIKAVLAADSDLSVFDISVTTAAGVVTLEGTVPSEEQLAQAVVVAMEAQGVDRVVSKLRVEPSSP